MFMAIFALTERLPTSAILGVWYKYEGLATWENMVAGARGIIEQVGKDKKTGTMSKGLQH